MKALYIAGALALAAMSSANMLVNGSFEDPVVGDGGSQGFIGQTIGSGWFSEGFAAINDNNFTGGGVVWHPTAYGNQYLYLNVFAGDNTITQSVNLTGGQVYGLSFMLADFGTQFSTPGAMVTYDVVDNNNVSMLGGPITISTADFADFARYGSTFTATSTNSYTVSFTSTLSHAANLDDIQLNPGAVPEPASMACLGLGVLALARKKRAHV